MVVPSLCRFPALPFVESVQGCSGAADGEKKCGERVCSGGFARVRGRKPKIPCHEEVRQTGFMVEMCIRDRHPGDSRTPAEEMSGDPFDPDGGDSLRPRSR